MRRAASAVLWGLGTPDRPLESVPDVASPGRLIITLSQTDVIRKTASGNGVESLKGSDIVLMSLTIATHRRVPYLANEPSRCDCQTRPFESHGNA